MPHPVILSKGMTLNFVSRSSVSRNSFRKLDQLLGPNVSQEDADESDRVSRIWITRRAQV